MSADVQRYQVWPGDLHTDNKMPDALYRLDVVKFTDHDAALRAARDEGWNAALDWAQTAAANVPLNTDSTYVRDWQLETWSGIAPAIAALRKPVQP